MPTNIGQFNLGVAQFTQFSVPQEASRAMRILAFEAFGRIMQRTPVDTGRLKGNWHISFGKPDESLVDGGPNAPGDARELASLTLAQTPPFESVFISNNVPYAKVIEEGGFRPKNPGPTKDPRKIPGAKKRKNKAGRTTWRFGKGVKRMPVQEKIGFGAEVKLVPHGPVLIVNGFHVVAPHGIVAITAQELKDFKVNPTKADALKQLGTQLDYFIDRLGGANG